MVGRFFGGLLHFAWLFIVAHWSLPRAINERQLRRWTPGGTAKFYQFGSSMYLWPLVPVGIYTLLLHHYNLVGEPLLGWIYLSMVIAVVTTLAIDIGRGLMVGLCLFAGLVVAVIAYLESAYGWQIGPWMSAMIAKLKMGYHVDWVLPLTVLSTVLFAINLVVRRYDCVLTVRGDQLTISRWAADTLSYQRGGWSFRARFKDLLEYLLGGGSGSLAIVNPVTGAELFIAEHVPGFSVIAARIAEQFASTDVTPAHPPRGGEEGGAHDD